MAHLIEISDRHWICPVYLDDTLECLASLVISSLVDEQKCKEQVPLYKSFRKAPALELDQAEDAIYNNDLKDIMDVMQEMMRVAKEAEK